MIFGGRAKGLRGEACLAPTGLPPNTRRGAGKGGTFSPDFPGQIVSKQGIGGGGVVEGLRAHRPSTPSLANFQL